MNTTIRSVSLILLMPVIFMIMVSGVDPNTSTSLVHISQKDGLPNNLVECILQDHSGYSWFGTKRGLCRYDGYDFTNYRSDIIDSTSLPYHHITALLEASDSTLWVGVWRNGLCKYNRDKNSFSTVISEKTSFPRLTINQLFEDSKKRIWVRHESGIFILSLSGEHIMEMDLPFVNGENQVSAMFETRMNKF